MHPIPEDMLLDRMHCCGIDEAAGMSDSYRTTRRGNRLLSSRNSVLFLYCTRILGHWVGRASHSIVTVDIKFLA